MLLKLVKLDKETFEVIEKYIKIGQFGIHYPNPNGDFNLGIKAVIQSKTTELVTKDTVGIINTTEKVYIIERNDGAFLVGDEGKTIKVINDPIQHTDFNIWVRWFGDDSKDWNQRGLKDYFNHIAQPIIGNGEVLFLSKGENPNKG